MKNEQKKDTNKNKKQLTPEQEEQERMELLRKAAENPGKYSEKRWSNDLSAGNE